jgi:hypothetical protein
LKPKQDKEEEKNGNNSKTTITEYAGNINSDVIAHISNIPTSNPPTSN